MADQALGVPLKTKSLVLDPEKFIWAVRIAVSPFNNTQVKIGEPVRDANALMPVNICHHILLIILSGIFDLIKKMYMHFCYLSLLHL